MKGSKCLETVLEFCDLRGKSELSKYPSITYFIYLSILFIIGFYIPSTCANTSKWSAGSRIWCLGPFMGFSCASDRPFVIERQVCSLTNYQTTGVNYTELFDNSLLQPYSA